MAFSIAGNKDRTFFIDISSDHSDVVVSHELLVLSYMRWNEIGLMVTAEVAPKIKDPKNPKEYIQDVAGQRKLDAEAEMKRNAMRVVVALEGGEGIDWGKDEPESLEAKAEVLINTDPRVFLGLMTGLRNRVFGGGVSTEDSEARFLRLSGESTEGVPQSKDHD